MEIHQSWCIRFFPLIFLPDCHFTQHQDCITILGQKWSVTVVRLQRQAGIPFFPFFRAEEIDYSLRLVAAPAAACASPVPHQSSEGSSPGILMTQRTRSVLTRRWQRPLSVTASGLQSYPPITRVGCDRGSYTLIVRFFVWNKTFQLNTVTPFCTPEENWIWTFWASNSRNIYYNFIWQWSMEVVNIRSEFWYFFNHTGNPWHLNSVTSSIIRRCLISLT